MEIIVLNKSFERIHIVEAFDSLLWIEKYSDFGTFELILGVTIDNITFLREDYYLQIADSSYTMIIESIQIKTDVEKGNQLIVRGRDLTSILDRRVIYQRTIFEDIPVQDAIEQLLNENGILFQPGQPARNIPGLVFLASTDPNVLAPTVTAQYYGPPIDETIKFFCERTNLGFRILLNAANEFEFSLFAGVDRSYNQTENPYVVFSPKFDNLKSSDYLFTKRWHKTIALISGDAYHFEDRPTVDFDPWENDPNDPNYGTIRTGLDRRELFVDAPDLNLIDPDTNLPFTNPTGTWILYERARQELNKNITYETFDGEIEQTNGYVYKEDFFLGDIVQIENEFGQKGRKRITEIVIYVSTSGKTIYPTYTTI